METNKPKPKKTYSVWHLAAVLALAAIVFKIGVALGTFGTVLGLVGILAGAVFVVKRPGRRILGAAAIFAAFWLLMGGWFASTKRDAEEAKAAQDATKEKQQLTLKASYADLIIKGDEKTKVGAHADALVLFRQAMSLPDLPVAERDQARLRLRDAAVLSGNVEEVKKAAAELASTLDRAQLSALIQKGEMPATSRGNPQVEAGLREPLVAAATERLTKLTEEEKANAAADAAKEKADADAEKNAKPAQYWENPALVRIATKTKFLENYVSCPDGLWALFPHDVLGADEFEAKANQPKRAELASEVKAKTFVATIEGDVAIGEYNFKRHAFPVTLQSVIFCSFPTKEELVSVTVAFAPAVARDPDAKHNPENKVGDYEWQPEPITHWISVDEQQARHFKSAVDRIDVDLSFSIGKTTRHSRVVRDGFGGKVDVGAGRLLLAKPLAVRLRAKDGRVLLDTAPSEPR